MDNAYGKSISNMAFYRLFGYLRIGHAICFFAFFSKQNFSAAFQKYSIDDSWVHGICRNGLLL